MAAGERPGGGQTHYQLLRLSTTATAQELRLAFRTLSKLYHPDTTTLPAAEAEQQFQRLQTAYTTLSDPDSRHAYDRQLRLLQLQKAAALQQATAAPAAPGLGVPAGQRALSARRALSGGEWFALVLLGAALVCSLVLGIGLAWWRGVDLLVLPVSVQTAPPSGDTAGDERPASASDAPLQPSVAGPGAMAAAAGSEPQPQ
ncbi:MAG: molecular chaperone DnaJ [Cyanobium sp.]|uniref:J domain-containing protein n=1 Tax=Synechococcus sp. CS-1333 TaxID=2848638 RepID=UPI000DBC23B7|nr:J domain-containing protein [Synechococcus sp. CS-1333]MCT0209377.1 J domain-containing protein [Synechococcus sp. CS-1333]PZV23962.1 MAG: molecular chaperone DnaJ [Cyanobium sp.]